MKKNGKLFYSIIENQGFIPSVWDPFVYRQNGDSHALSEFVTIQSLTKKRLSANFFPFLPIEYKNIPGPNYLSFELEINHSKYNPSGLSVAGENELLFGTMRAYLGNALLTPLGSHVNISSPIFFYIKSEFVIISPHDDLKYFWLAYLRSKPFLDVLPLGSGGTRPRLQKEILGRTPVKIPNFPERIDINDKLRSLAIVEWKNYTQTMLLINAMKEEI